MRLGIDARPLQAETKHRGIGKALERTLIPLSKICKQNDDELILFYDQSFGKPTVELDGKVIYESFNSPKLKSKKYVRVVVRPFRKLTLKKGFVDSVLQFDFNLGIPKYVPTVVMFHDLIPVLFRSADLKNQRTEKGMKKIKQALGGKLQWSRYQKDLRCFNKASKILAISESSRRDLLKFDKNIKPSDVEVAYLGIDQNIGSRDTDKISESIKKLTKMRFLLYVGGIDTRKNIVQLVKDFYSLKVEFPDLKLVVVGKEFGLQKNLKQVGWTDEVSKNLRFAKDIIFPGFVSDGELRSLYASAQAFVFPSLYEGFGLPILEAMALSCHVVAYKNSSIPEIAGNAAILVENGNDMSGPISELLKNQALRNKMIESGLKQALGFPWQKTAEKIYTFLKQVSYETK